MLPNSYRKISAGVVAPNHQTTASDGNLPIEFLVIPKQIFFIHDAIFPVRNGDQLDFVGFAGRWDDIGWAKPHGPGEGAGHGAGHRGPFTVGKLYRVGRDAGVRHPDEHGHQIFHVLVQALGDMAIGPVHVQPLTPH